MQAVECGCYLVNLWIVVNSCDGIGGVQVMSASWIEIKFVKL